MKYAIFGDVGGHYDSFVQGLKTVGVSINPLFIPEDLTIVQVGDLIHKGDFSFEVLCLVRSFTKKYPNQWVQLIGNHELPYISKQAFFYPDRIDKKSERILLGLYDNGSLLNSYAITNSNGEDYFISHAGLTSFWFDAIAKVSGATAQEVSNTLNSMNLNHLLSSGTMLNGSYPRQDAGIFWASSFLEVYFSWTEYSPEVPFHQIHGHSSSMDWDRLKTFVPKKPWAMDHLTKDYNEAKSIWTWGGKNFHSIDPNFGINTPDRINAPLIIE